MKKIIPGLLIVLAVVGIGYSMMTSSSKSGTSSSPTPVKVAAAASPVGESSNGVGPGAPTKTADDVDEGEGDDADEEEAKPASEVYKSASEAIEAVKKGAVDYDDILLEQFTTPGADCTWCPDFYKQVKDLLGSPDVKNDQKSYYAEILAISGRIDNVSSLIDSYKNATKPEDKELFSEAIELITGKDDMVQYLGKQLSTDNSDLKESIVAAITNQGSPLAIDTLYKAAVDSGDPDGYYAQGIGLGEVIPDDESLPKLQEMVQKRDQYSHLAVKSLLNSGIGGLRIVMDILATSSDPEADKRMLKDAKDHVNYEEEIETYLKQLSETSKSSLVKDFSKEILDDFNSQQEEDDATTGDLAASGAAEPPMTKR